MSKKFLSDVLIECGLQVSGTTTLGTATATTVATSDNSTNIATTAFVKAQGYTSYTSWNLKTNSVQRTTVASGGTLDLIAGSGVTLSYAAGGKVTIAATGSVDYIDDVRLNGTSLDFSGQGSAFAGSVDLSSLNTVSAISDLTDVDTTTSAPSNGEALVWDGTNWVPGTISTTNNYLTGLSFNTSDGVLTATRQGLGDLTVDLDGRYLTSYTETDTLATVTARGATTSDAVTISNTLTLSHSSTSVVFSGNSSGNFTIDNNTGSIAFQANGSTVNSLIITSSLITLNENVQANGYIDMGSNTITDTKVGQWDTAYNWGDHSTAGYLTSYTEADTLDTVADRGATTDKSLTIGNTLTLTRTGGVATLNTNTSGNDPQFIRFDESTANSGYVWIAVSDDFDVSASNDVFYIGDSNLTDWRFKVLGNGAIYSREGTTERQLATRDWVTSQSYITGYTETDPIFTASAASHIAAGDITNWDSAYGWGNHGTAGYLLASQMTDYSLNPRFSASIGFSNDTEILQFQDNNGQTKAGYWTSLDAFLINGDGNSNTNILLKTGNIYVNQNQFIVGKLGVQGLIELDNNSGVTLYSNGGTGDPAGVKIESFDSAAFIGAFLDFTIYDDGKDHMRSGTLQIVFNAAEVRFNEVNTLDIGDTSGCTLEVHNTAGVAEVYFTTPDPTFNIKYQVRTL